MIVDCHAHIVPPGLPQALRASAERFPSVRLIEEGGSLAFSFAGGPPTRPVPPPLSDLTAREAWMKAQGIDRQVAGGWLDIFAYEIPVEEGIAWSRLTNEHLLAAARERPAFVPLATLPMQDGAAAASVLAEAMDQGFPGAMIGTQPKGKGSVLDDPDLDPFWAMADARGAAVFVHPVFDSGDDRVRDYGLANAIGRVSDTLIAVSRLLCSGHVLKYANAKIIASVGGAALPYVLGRLKRNCAISDGLADPEAGLRALYYDTIVQDPRTLRFLVDVVGSDRLMMGSDMPFPIGDPEPQKVVDDCGFSTREAALVKGGLAAKLFSL